MIEVSFIDLKKPDNMDFVNRVISQGELAGELKTGTLPITQNDRCLVSSNGYGDIAGMLISIDIAQPDYWWLFKLYVLPEWRCKGHGAALMQRFITDAAGADIERVGLGTDHDNKRMATLAVQFGYKRMLIDDFVNPKSDDCTLGFENSMKEYLAKTALFERNVCET